MSAEPSPSAEPIRIQASENWQLALSELVTDPQALMTLLKLDPREKPVGLAAQEAFPLRVPRPFVARMQAGNWQDPLLRQVWPAVEEAQAYPGLVGDPLREQTFTRAPGLLQKYHGRVLLTVAPHCAIHCRYCFRRHFDYAANSPSRDAWQHSLEFVRADESIHEVILSGG
ncbi:MAG: EF-P beta-lysylation protein EpmB, partial [Halieaceae bacterium]|nr:EF-P beta-lysylation protein EpmB [Halieaceae bacterium]